MTFNFDDILDNYYKLQFKYKQLIEDCIYNNKYERISTEFDNIMDKIKFFDNEGNIILEGE
jgi:hypothetical protein